MSRDSSLINILSIDGFRQLWEGIRDVAVNDFRYLPEDTKPVCQLMQAVNAPSALLTLFTVGQRCGSRSAIPRQCDFQISAVVYRERCCDLSTGVRYSKLPIDDDCNHHTATIFRGTDGGSGSQIWGTANGFDSGHHLKCSSGDFEPRVVLAVDDG